MTSLQFQIQSKSSTGFQSTIRKYLVDIAHLPPERSTQKAANFLASVFLF
jgi:hypothetical protein